MPMPSTGAGPRLGAAVPSGARRRRVLCVCPGVWDHEALARADREEYELLFHGEELVESPSLVDALRFDPFRWAEQTTVRFRGAGLAGVVGTGDYPGCMLAAMVADRLGLPTPPPATVVQLSHKYYSRVLQRRIVPEATPAFEPIDPLARRAEPGLAYPVFVKPVKGTMSIRARLARDRQELREAFRFTLRERVEKQLLLRPFAHMLRRYSDGRVPAHWFVAEAPLRGVQVTVDGFVERGRAVIMGVVDSVMYPGTNSFARFEYPSSLPAEVQARMAELARRFVEGVGFDASCFNVEMFWDEATDAVHLIEINPRMSYQFGDLYERVDGTNTYAVQLALATGAPAPWRPGAGRSAVAASFVLRRFADARVVRVPDAGEIARLAARFEGATVKVLCEPGKRLSQYDQDVGSYRLAIVNMGAPSREELHARWEQAQRMLTFALA